MERHGLAVRAFIFAYVAWGSPPGAEPRFLWRFLRFGAAGADVENEFVG